MNSVPELGLRSRSERKLPESACAEDLENSLIQYSAFIGLISVRLLRLPPVPASRCSSYFQALVSTIRLEEAQA